MNTQPQDDKDEPESILVWLLIAGLAWIGIILMIL